MWYPLLDSIQFQALYRQSQTSLIIMFSMHTASAVLNTMSVGYSATAFRNFAIRQLSIPQNDIRQRDQMAKIFRKK